MRKRFYVLLDYGGQTSKVKWKGENIKVIEWQVMAMSKQKMWVDSLMTRWNGHEEERKCMIDGEVSGSKSGYDNYQY